MKIANILKNDALVSKIDVDTAENGPSQGVIELASQRLLPVRPAAQMMTAALLLAGTAGYEYYHFKQVAFSSASCTAGSMDEPSPFHHDGNLAGAPFRQEVIQPSLTRMPISISMAGITARNTDSSPIPHRRIRPAHHESSS